MSQAAQFSRLQRAAESNKMLRQLSKERLKLENNEEKMEPRFESEGGDSSQLMIINQKDAMSMNTYKLHPANQHVKNARSQITEVVDDLNQPVLGNQVPAFRLERRTEAEEMRASASKSVT